MRSENGYWIDESGNRWAQDTAEALLFIISKKLSDIGERNII